MIASHLGQVIVLASGDVVDPEEIEAHYRRSVLVREVCVLSIPGGDAPAAERLHAVVVPDFDVLRARRIVNIRDWLRFELENLSVHLPPARRVPAFDVWTNPLPRNTAHGIDRQEVQRRVRAAETGSAKLHDPQAAVEVQALDPELGAIGPVIRRRRARAVSREASIELDLGLDSMERIEFFAEVEARLGVTLTEAATQRIYTLGDLADAVADARRAGSTPLGGPARDASGLAAPDQWAGLLGSDSPDDAFLAELRKPKRVLGVVMFALLKIVHAAAWLLLGFRVSGRSHLPARGPFIVCPNHESYLDGLLVCCGLPYSAFRSIFLVGASEYFSTPLMARLARLWNIVPVDPDAALLRALRLGAAGLRLGRVLVLFPEGERSIDGEVTAFRKGAVVLASRLDVPLVPAAFDGLFEVWPRSRPFRWRALRPGRGGRSRLVFGAPVTAGDLGARAESDGVAAERLRQAVIALKRAHPSAGGRD